MHPTSVTKLSDLASNDADAAAPTCASTIHTTILYATTVASWWSASTAEHAKAACNLLQKKYLF